MGRADGKAPHTPALPGASDRYELRPIGIIRSCYKDKFGVPRQPGLVTAAEARLELFDDLVREESLAGLKGFSHLWLIFVFHLCLGAGWKPAVRPPRLGGNRKVGVFASRSPFRPNPIGLSAVELVGIERDGKNLSLRLRGADMVDGTPVLDIKPYVPYADALPDAAAGFATEPPRDDRPVNFTPEARRQILDADPAGDLRLALLIEQILRQDPRPAYMDRRSARTDFGMRLYELNVKWSLTGDGAMVTAVLPIGVE
jgi:tRNA-Thr(GGU) m(6)t(6)A37 methyltransferase TsaA